jgi:hypothetical protein
VAEKIPEYANAAVRTTIKDKTKVLTVFDTRTESSLDPQVHPAGSGQIAATDALLPPRHTKQEVCLSLRLALLSYVK